MCSPRPLVRPLLQAPHEGCQCHWDEPYLGIVEEKAAEPVYEQAKQCFDEFRRKRILLIGWCREEGGGPTAQKREIEVESEGREM